MGCTKSSLFGLQKWLAPADWLVSGVGVDFGGITRPHPAFRLANHFVGFASHFAPSGLRSLHVM